jgi:integrase
VRRDVNKPYHFLHNPPDLTCAEARRSLPPRDHPFWNYLMPAVALGYRRAARSAFWIVRHREKPWGERAKYRFHTFAFADDFDPADGDEILSFDQARARAMDIYLRARFNRTERGKGDAIYFIFDDLPPATPYTFAHALRDYLYWRSSTDYHVEADFYNSRAYILPSLGTVPVDQLTRPQLYECITDIVDSTVRVSMAFGPRHRMKGPPRSADERRRRQLIANRVLNLVCRTLDYAYSTGKLNVDFGWYRIPRYRGVNIPRDRHLSPEECRRLLRFCDPDLARIVQGLLLTGCRFGELQRLRVKNFDERTGHLRIEKTKKRMPRVVSLTPRACTFFARLCAGEEPDELVFVPEGRSRWEVFTVASRLKFAAKRAKVPPPVNTVVMRHTYASQAVMAGIPLNIVAKQLGHSDTKNLERHYAHLTEDYVDDFIRRKMPNLA